MTREECFDLVRWKYEYHRESFQEHLEDFGYTKSPARKLMVNLELFLLRRLGWPDSRTHIYKWIQFGYSHTELNIKPTEPAHDNPNDVIILGDLPEATWKDIQDWYINDLMAASGGDIDVARKLVERLPVPGRRFKSFSEMVAPSTPEVVQNVAKPSSNYLSRFTSHVQQAGTEPLPALTLISAVPKPR